MSDSGQSGRRIPPSVMCDVARRGGLPPHLPDDRLHISELAFGYRMFHGVSGRKLMIADLHCLHRIHTGDGDEERRHRDDKPLPPSHALNACRDSIAHRQNLAFCRSFQRVSRAVVRTSFSQ